MNIEQRAIELVTADIVKRLAKGDADAKKELEAMVRQSLRPATCSCIWRGWHGVNFLQPYNGFPNHSINMSTVSPKSIDVSCGDPGNSTLRMPGYEVAGQNGSLMVMRADSTVVN